MKLSKEFFRRIDRQGLSHAERYLLIDAIRRLCEDNCLDGIDPGGSNIPVRLRWARGVNSAGLSREGYRLVRKRLVAAGLIDRCRDGDKRLPDGRPKVMRDWFVIRIG